MAYLCLSKLSWDRRNYFKIPKLYTSPLNTVLALHAVVSLSSDQSVFSCITVTVLLCPLLQVGNREVWANRRCTMEGQIHLRLCFPPRHRRENAASWTHVCTSAHEHDHYRLHAYLLQVSTLSHWITHCSGQKVYIDLNMLYIKARKGNGVKFSMAWDKYPRSVL